MNSSLAKPSRNYWPHAIIAWFVIFAAALGAWVTVAVRQKMDLVRADYYEEEVRYQGQVDRLNRTAALRSEVAIEHFPALDVHHPRIGRTLPQNGEHGLCLQTERPGK